jgi:hypothetical protein
MEKKLANSFMGGHIIVKQGKSQNQNVDGQTR